MRKIVFELCAETIGACLAAKEGKADRIELCSGLSEGGFTPSHGMIDAAVRLSGRPVHVLVRPRGGDFVYSPAEVDLMHEDVRHAKALGASGVVIGLLLPDGRVDLDATSALVEAANPMRVTFHRAFDVSRSVSEALEEVIASGCDRVLTSGGERDIVAGADALIKLVAQADGRIDVAVGGGLRMQNAAWISRTIGATHFHGSLRRKVQSQGVRTVSEAADDSERIDGDYTVDAHDIRAVIDLLKGA